MQTNNYYFMTPSSISTPIISLIDTTTNWTITNINPVTFTFYFKFFGINSAVPTPPLSQYPIFYFKGTTSYFGYDSSNKQFILMINESLAFKYTNILNIIGSWTNISLSVYNSGGNTTFFPHMLNFFLFNQIILPQSTFNVGTTAVTLDNLSFSYYAVCLFSNLKIYRNFYIAPYGFINGSVITIAKDLIVEYTLSNPSSSTCLSNSDLKTQNVLGIGLVCINDYNPFQDSKILCNNDLMYFNSSISVSTHCQSI